VQVRLETASVATGDAAATEDRLPQVEIHGPHAAEAGDLRTEARAALQRVDHERGVLALEELQPLGRALERGHETAGRMAARRRGSGSVTPMSNRSSSSAALFERNAFIVPGRGQ